jgi:hypothetical protein
MTMRGSRLLVAMGFGLVLASGACGGSGAGGSAEDTLELCTDGQDNDGDGKKDCDDDDCQVFVACLPGNQDGNVRLPDAAGDGALAGDQPGPGDGKELAGDAAGPEAVVGPDVSDAVADTGGNCQPCGYGSLKGRVCAPSQQVYVAGATVTIKTKDCSGEPLTLTATSNIEGVYQFDSVPCGMQTVEIKKGSFAHSFEVPITAGKLTDVSGADIKMCFAASAVSIAILWGQWDEMNDIVTRLGFAYDWFYFEDELYADDTDWETVEVVKMLRDPTWLGQYNILILNCGSAYQKWVVEFPDIVMNLQDFVLNGGSLYASDLAWIMEEKAFPDGIDFYGEDEKGYMATDGPQVIDGNQDFDAFLVDADLASYVGGGKIQVHYGPGPLIAVAAAGEGTAVHAKALIKQCQGLFDDCTSGVKLNEEQPVILSFQPGPTSGRVVFSGFHVDEQAEQEKYDKILYYMLFML